MIRQTLVSDQLTALKTHDAKRLETIRYILAQIKNKEIDKKSELTDIEVCAVLRKLVKEFKESIEAFTKGGRSDLIQEYQNQLAIITSYLPPEMSDVDLKKEVQKIINNNQDLYNKNAKAIIGVCMKELKNKADSSRIIKILNSLSS